MADRDSGRRTHRGRATRTRAVRLSGITPCSVWSAPQPWMAARPRWSSVGLRGLVGPPNLAYRLAYRLSFFFVSGVGYSMCGPAVSPRLESYRDRTDYDVNCDGVLYARTGE
eukprot:378109-Prymnesium_polylepis.1